MKVRDRWHMLAFLFIVLAINLLTWETNQAARLLSAEARELNTLVKLNTQFINWVVQYANQKGIK